MAEFKDVFAITLKVLPSLISLVIGIASWWSAASM